MQEQEHERGMQEVLKADNASMKPGEQVSTKDQGNNVLQTTDQLTKEG